MKRTTGQNKRLHQLLFQLGIDVEMKSILAREFSKGRTDKTSKLSVDEMNMLICALEGKENAKIENAKKKRADVLRKKIISVLYYLPVEFGFYHQYENYKKFNAKKFDDFLYTDIHSPFKGKKFNELEIKELNRLMAVMSQWVEFYKTKNNEKVYNTR